MEYIVILDAGSMAHQAITNSNGFIKTFLDYEDAKAEGEAYARNVDCKDFTVFENVD